MTPHGLRGIPLVDWTAEGERNRGLAPRDSASPVRLLIASWFGGGEACRASAIVRSFFCLLHGSWWSVFCGQFPDVPLSSQVTTHGVPGQQAASGFCFFTAITWHGSFFFLLLLLLLPSGTNTTPWLLRQQRAHVCRWPRPICQRVHALTPVVPGLHYQAGLFACSSSSPWPPRSNIPRPPRIPHVTYGEASRSPTRPVPSPRMPNDGRHGLKIHEALRYS